MQKKKRKKESKYIFVPAPPRTFLLEMSSDIVLCVYELTHSGRKEGYYYKEGKTPLNSFKSTYPSWNISRLYQVRIKRNWLHAQRTIKCSLEMNWYNGDVWFNVSVRQILALILNWFEMNNSDFIRKMSLSTNRGAWKT